MLQLDTILKVVRSILILPASKNICFLLSCSFPTLHFLQTVAKIIFWVNIQMDAFLFVFSCNISWWFWFSVQFWAFLSVLLQILPFFFNYYFYFLNVLLYIKRAELRTIQGREAREFYVTKSLFWYIKHRDTARLCYHFINLFFLIKISL